MSEIYIKTAKGRDEIETKASGLGPIIRRVLIYIDGQRTIADLQRLPRVQDLSSILQMLEQEGYITRLMNPDTDFANTGAAADKVAAATVTKTTAALNTSVPIPTLNSSRPTAGSSLVGNGLSFRPLPPPNDLAKLTMARNFMINTLNHFVGAYGVSALTSRIALCSTHSDLRICFDEWDSALQETREGRKELVKLRKQLLEII